MIGTCCGDRLRLGIGRVHERPFADFLYPFNDDAVAGMKSFLDDPLRADSFPDAHELDVHFVFRINDRDLKTALQFRNGFLWDEQRAIGEIKFDMDASELTGAQDVIWIRE